MPDSARPWRIVFSPSAQSDIDEALRWGHEWFGERAVQRYRILLRQALRDIAANPELAGSRARPEYAGGIRTYHLAFSRTRAASKGGYVKEPRHVTVYRPQGEKEVLIVRVLHESSELNRHME